MINIYTRKINTLFGWTVFMAVLLVSCNKNNSESIIIATAANAQFAVEEIVEKFENETGINVEIVSSSSGKHTAQIEAGAPYDVFISADMKYPEQLYKLGLTENKPKVYAYGKLVLWTLNDIPAESIKDLPLIKATHIAIPNPKTAPYGRAAMEALQYYQLFDTLKNQLVYGESIAQANQFILSKSVDIGFSAASVAMAPKMKGKGKWFIVDTSSYSPIEQGAVILSNSSNINSAMKFYDYLFSDVSKDILIRHGYEVTDNNL
ncbi:MAG: molybdate ABC transporter substrate-binding protein [Bacteroidota bacterium]